jgi:hypothetical protein
LDDGRDRREGDGAQGDEALEGAEGNGNEFGFFGCAAHEDGAKEVFSHLRLGIARRYIQEVLVVLVVTLKLITLQRNNDQPS